MIVNISYLKSELSQPSSVERRRARVALIELGEEAIPTLVDALSDSRHLVKQEAIKALERIGDDAATQGISSESLPQHACDCGNNQKDNQSEYGHYIASICQLYGAAAPCCVVIARAKARCNGSRLTIIKERLKFNRG